MNPRLIPWCFAATGFLVALGVFSWHGKLGETGQRIEAQGAHGQRLSLPAVDHRVLSSAQAPAATAAPANVTTLTLPLPPATPPAPDPEVQTVPEDQPTVEDLPARRSPPESPEGE
jgi:hypothetical protein